MGPSAHSETHRQPSLIYALTTLGAIVLTVLLGSFVAHADLHALLVLATAVAAMAAYGLGYRWPSIVKAMGAGVSRAVRAMFIFILIGMLIGSWIQSGTVATLIHYGLDLVGARFFLPAGLVLCALMSLATGTAWGTAGTMGVALMGIGGTLGIPLPLVAGMIVSGASFGDKMSPVSDTTNLAAISAGADLYDHIRGMLYTTGPTFLLCLVVYYVLGLSYGGTDLDPERIVAIQSALAGEFQISGWLLIPPLVLLTLSICKVHPEPSMAAGVLAAVVLAGVVQGASAAEALGALNRGYEAHTGVALVDELLTRGGIQNMMWTFSLATIALALGGILDALNVLEVIVRRLVAVVRRTAALVAMTISSSVMTNMAMGEGYLSIILNGRLYSQEYARRGLQPHMLSRCVEEGATLSTSIIPWTTSGAFFASALGVPVVSYLPYAVLNWFNPLLSIALVSLGLTVFAQPARQPG
jgi:NhaC family Na+:H+ antiporter